MWFCSGGDLSQGQLKYDDILVWGSVIILKDEEVPYSSLHWGVWGLKWS